MNVPDNKELLVTFEGQDDSGKCLRGLDGMITDKGKPILCAERFSVSHMQDVSHNSLFLSHTQPLGVGWQKNYFAHF